MDSPKVAVMRKHLVSLQAKRSAVANMVPDASQGAQLQLLDSAIGRTERAIAGEVGLARSRAQLQRFDEAGYAGAE